MRIARIHLHTQCPSPVMTRHLSTIITAVARPKALQVHWCTNGGISLFSSAHQVEKLLPGGTLLDSMLSRVALTFAHRALDALCVATSDPDALMFFPASMVLDTIGSMILSTAGVDRSNLSSPPTKGAAALGVRT